MLPERRGRRSSEDRRAAEKESEEQRRQHPLTMRALTAIRRQRRRAGGRRTAHWQQLEYMRKYEHLSLSAIGGYVNNNLVEIKIEWNDLTLTRTMRPSVALMEAQSDGNVSGLKWE